VIEAVSRATIAALQPTVEAVSRTTLAALQPAIEALSRAAAGTLWPALDAVSQATTAAFQAPIVTSRGAMVESLQPPLAALLNTPEARASLDGLLDAAAVKTSLASVEERLTRNGVGGDSLHGLVLAAAGSTRAWKITAAGRLMLAPRRGPARERRVVGRGPHPR
jgi:hypothetical protein